MNFFSEFSPSGRVWAEFGFNIRLISFLAYFILSNPFLAKTNAGKLFFNFLIFFAVFFFAIFSPGSSMSGIRVKNYFVSFSAYLILSRPLFAKNNNRKLFCNFFEFFCYFFSEFSPPGRVWAELESKIVFSLSRPVSSQFG